MFNSLGSGGSSIPALHNLDTIPNMFCMQKSYLNESIIITNTQFLLKTRQCFLCGQLLLLVILDTTNITTTINTCLHKKCCWVFRCFFFPKSIGKPFLQMFSFKKYVRTTKMWYTSQLSLAIRVLWDPSRCSELHAPVPAFLTAVRCPFWCRNQVSALSASLAHPFPSQHGRSRKMPSPPPCRLQQWR